MGNINIRISDEEKSRLKIAAQNECRTITQLVRVLIHRFLNEGQENQDALSYNFQCPSEQKARLAELQS